MKSLNRKRVFEEDYYLFVNNLLFIKFLSVFELDSLFKAVKVYINELV